jgi:hypothetical protein
MTKKFITYLLLFTLLVQILPVRQIGGILFSNQLSEELPHTEDTDDTESFKGLIKKDFFAIDTYSMDHSMEVFIHQHHLMDDTLPNNHAEDIHVPPPNC